MEQHKTEHAINQDKYKIRMAGLYIASTTLKLITNKISMAMLPSSEKESIPHVLLRKGVEVLPPLMLRLWTILRNPSPSENEIESIKRDLSEIHTKVDKIKISNV